MINPQSLDVSSLPSVFLKDRKNLPQTPSIYFAIDSLGTIQYIGRSVNPRNRWASHHRANQLEDNCRIAWLDCDESLLNEVEEALISFFNPPLNGFDRSQQSDKTQSFVPKSGGLYNTIKEFCDKQGITPYALGKKSGVSCQTVYRLTGNQRYLPSITVVEKICEAFDVQANELVKHQKSVES